MTEKQSVAMKAIWAKRKADGTNKRGPYKQKTKKKGKWSKIAKIKHSVRMKERWSAKKVNINPKSVVAINKVSVQERLNIIEHNVNAIRQQLGG